MRLRTFVCVASLAVAGSVFAGPLNPPAGAIVSSGKTLAELEPRTAVSLANTPGDANSVFKITQPGSYYLTGNITGANAKYGIEVAADNVTIDLNGFTMQGVAGAFDAVRGDGGALLARLTVKNGTITGWTNGSGVFAGNMAECRVEGVAISSVGFEGVWIGGRGVIERCTTKTTRGGLRVGANSVVRGCSVETATERGIYTGDESLVSGCTVKSATLAGIEVQHRSTVEDCQVRNCQTGVFGRDHVTVKRTSAWSSTSHGIFCVDYGVVTDCEVLGGSQAGVRLMLRGTALRCSVKSVAGTGIEASAESTITDCNVVGCGGNGISATGGGCTVTRCKATSNTFNGIQIAGGAVVSGNHCGYNSDAGIVVYDSGTRVEDNHCVANEVGILTESSGSFYVRNTCRTNTTNWNLAANNQYGPIIDRTAAGTPAVSGNSASDQSGSTHPNANFSY